MSKTDELTLRALKSEFKRVSALESKAKAEYDEYMNIHHELIAINKEFAQIVKENRGKNSLSESQKTLDKLEALKKRQDRAKKVTDKDLMKLIDSHQELELEKIGLIDAISILNFELKQRGIVCDK